MGVKGDQQVMKTDTNGHLKHHIDRAIGLVGTVGLVLAFAILGLVIILWPMDASVPARVLAYPLATLTISIALFVMFRLSRKKQSDGSYVFEGRVRQVFAFSFLFVFIATCVITIMSVVYVTMRP